MSLDSRWTTNWRTKMVTNLRYADDIILLATSEAEPGPILSMFPALIVHSELKSVHPGFPVAFIF